MTFLFLVRGLGEFSQAESLAKFAKKKKVKSFFAIDDAIEDIVKEEELNYKIVKTAKDARELIDKIKPRALFLCNSKTSRPLIKDAPTQRMAIFSIDSNWLFGQTNKFKVYDWIDCFLVVFPKKIFDLGLRKNGGFYTIPKKYLDKIFCSGFIPSGKKLTEPEKLKSRNALGITKDEKLIFGYFGKGLTYRAFLTPKLLKVVEKLCRDGYKIKLFWCGPKFEIKKDFLIQPKNYITTANFDKIAASADLIVQHHGLGTLAKIIHNQIPTITFIPEKFTQKPKIFRHSPSYEIEAFEKAGICKSLTYKSKLIELEKLVLKLLYNKDTINQIKRKQKKIFVSGEEAVFNKVLSIINKKK